MSVEQEPQPGLLGGREIFARIEEVLVREAAYLGQLCVPHLTAIDYRTSHSRWDLDRTGELMRDFRIAS